MIVYGIPNCDTVKRARVWLNAHDRAFEFHNFKTMGVDVTRLQRWADVVGWETLLNRAGTTFRKLADADKADLDRNKAIALMLVHPSAIKRPVVEVGDQVLVGFKPDVWTATLG